MALFAPRPSIAAEKCLDGLLHRRRMVRKFAAAPVSDETIRRLVDHATRAPSAGHTEPWSFVVVREPKTRVALARAALGQRFVAEAPVAIVACADRSRVTPRYGARAEQYALIDTAFASLLLLLAVVEEGLGATFVGAFRDAEVAKILGLPSDVQPVAIIPVGAPAESPPKLRRRKTAQVLRHERW
jgi:nitroreductase